DSLRGRLPVYMVPAALVQLPQLPTNANGKVDRGALPRPLAASSNQIEVLGPRNELEEQIAKVWREVLRVERVGIREGFFDVGGHSLLLVDLHGKLQEELGRPVSILEM